MDILAQRGLPQNSPSPWSRAGPKPVSKTWSQCWPVRNKCCKNGCCAWLRFCQMQMAAVWITTLFSFSPLKRTIVHETQRTKQWSVLWESQLFVTDANNESTYGRVTEMPARVQSCTFSNLTLCMIVYRSVFDMLVQICIVQWTNAFVPHIQKNSFIESGMCSSRHLPVILQPRWRQTWNNHRRITNQTASGLAEIGGS